VARERAEQFSRAGDGAHVGRGLRCLVEEPAVLQTVGISIDSDCRDAAVESVIEKQMFSICSDDVLSHRLAGLPERA
jgi:hypothetical protein